MIAVAQAAERAERAERVARVVEWAGRVARTAAAEPWGLGERVVVARVVVARVAARAKASSCNSTVCFGGWRVHPGTESRLGWRWAICTSKRRIRRMVQASPYDSRKRSQRSLPRSHLWQ